MSPILRISLAGMVASLLSNAVPASEVLWFSDDPPSKEAEQKTRHAHGGTVEVGRGGLFMKRLWTRVGESPAESGLASPDAADGRKLTLLHPDGTVTDVESFSDPRGFGFLFPMPKEGFYNAYFVEQVVDGDTLYTRVVKAEALKHNCGEGHDHVAGLMAPNALQGAPLDIIRERLPKEDFHTRIMSGDRVSFRVLYKGQPAAGAEVKMVTAKGWAKTLTADAEGRVTYEMIRDYYPPWTAFDKRQKQNFLVRAAYGVDEAGTLNDKPYGKARYVVTLPGIYYPAKQEYASYLYGLLLGLFALTATGVGVYVHRTRRGKSCREERFDEKA